MFFRMKKARSQITRVTYWVYGQTKSPFHIFSLRNTYLILEQTSDYSVEDKRSKLFESRQCIQIWYRTECVPVLPVMQLLN